MNNRSWSTGYFIAWAATKPSLVGEKIWPETVRAKYAEAVNATLNLLMETKKESLAVHGISIRRIIIRVEAGARP